MGRPNFNNRQRGIFNSPYGRGGSSNNFNDRFNSNFNPENNNRASFGQGFVYSYHHYVVLQIAFLLFRYNQDNPSGPMRRGNMQGYGRSRGYAPYSTRGRSENNQGASWTSWD